MKTFFKVIGWISLGLVGLIVIAVIFHEDASGQLEVRTEQGFRYTEQGFVHYVIWIKNIGQEPMSINGVKVNNRPECTPSSNHIVFENGSFKNKAGPETLKVGETAFRGSHCEVVRAAIETNKGSFEYTFNSRR